MLFIKIQYRFYFYWPWSCIHNLNIYKYYSWTSVFEDVESGINHYKWYIGSHPGYYDIMSRAMVTGEECGHSNTPLDLLDGHSYYITVEVFTWFGFQEQYFL